jgi:endonuclease/exonuclease/phosphatase family metal-dependent hydrolase
MKTARDFSTFNSRWAAPRGKRCTFFSLDLNSKVLQKMRIVCSTRNKLAMLFASLTLHLLTTGLLHSSMAQLEHQGTKAVGGPAIKVLSYNIRYGSANDGDNHWIKRSPEVVNLIREWDPDLLGIQESLAFQTDFLREKLPAYEVIGVGRDDGKQQGEMVAVFFRRQRFQIIDSGNFWLSENPQVVASRSWDSSMTRMATWIRLKDLSDVKQREIVFLNTHFDHIGETSRIESSKLLRQKLLEISVQRNLIIVGDFNADEGSKPYQVLLDRSDHNLSLIDTYRQVYPSRKAGEGTFSNFQGSQIDGARIDWILASSNWKVESASIDRTESEGRTPSDHFPVKASLLWPD